MKRLGSKLIITALVAGGLAAAAPVFANAYGHGDRWCGHRSHMGGYGDPEDGIEHMAKRLDLTGDQLKSVRAIEDKNRLQLRNLRDQMRANHKQLRELAIEQTPDAGRLRSVADAQGKAIADMIVLRAEMRAEIDRVLTDKQREKLHHMGGKGKWEHDKD